SWITKEYPNIFPRNGLFAYLPLERGSFDFIFSLTGFPMYAYYATEDPAEMTRINCQVVDALAPGGEDRFYPVSESDASEWSQMLRERYGDAVEASPIRAHPTYSDVTLVVRKK